MDADTSSISILRNMLEAFEFPAVLVSSHHKPLAWNKAAAAMLGAANQEPMPLRSLFQLSESELSTWIQDRVPHREQMEEEWVDITPPPEQNKQSWARVRCRVVFLGKGETGYLFAFHPPRESPSDERYQGLAQALEAAEERFNVLFRESSDPVLMLSVNGDIVAANHGFERFTGWRSEQMFSGERTWADCVHPDDMNTLETRIKEAIAQGREQLFEIRLANDDGFYQWFEQSVNPLHDPQGETQGFVAVARNIHRRKELEVQLREKAQDMKRRHQRAQLLIAKLKHFFSRLSALPSDLDGYMSGVCETLSDMYQPFAAIIRITGKEPRVFHAGQARLDHAQQEDSATMCKHVMETGMPLYSNSLNATEPYRDDPFVRAYGLITYLGAPLRDSTGAIRGALSILDNEKRYYDNVDVELITVAALHVAARLRGEEQEALNRELADHLRQAQKMEAVGLLAGGIAHDFNNILSGILGFSSYLLSKVDEESIIHRDLKLIEQSAVRASDLTRQLLAFARRKHFQKEPVSMNAALQEVLALLRRSIPKHIAIEEQYDASTPLVHGDPGQLNQVVMNLCLNAADAMRDMRTGTLRIATETRALTPRERVILSDSSEGPYVCVTIADSGPGMSEEVQEHIFEPFFTTKSSQGGTGLGLSIVYGIVSNHEGHVVVDSAEGEGTVFTLYLPQYQGSLEGAEEETGTLARGTETILVIDDETIVRQMVSEVLRGHGYHVVAAESGAEGARFMDELRGKVHLVLLDMLMPDMDGEATFKLLRRIDPSLPIMLTSGYVQEEKSARLIQQGAMGMIYKPYKSDVLLRRIRKALDALGSRTVG
jgi:PAS domain S-box-containing protein